MMKEYIDALIDNLPEEVTKNTEPLCIDLVLDGGSFNGSYLIGALLFLKEMERRQYVKIKRISGCSIGSVVGLLYLMDSLETMMELYKVAAKHFKENHNLEVIKILPTLLQDKIPDDICSRVNDRLFISYNNVKTNKKRVRHKYKNKEQVFHTIVKSCFLPYLIDGKLTYQNQYIDGFTPFVFSVCKDRRKVLYFDLFGYDKIFKFLNIKNETTNLYRVFSGMLDIHYFYLKGTNTSMCSYINDWSWYNKSFFCLKWIVERAVVLIVQTILYFKSFSPKCIEKTHFAHILQEWIKELYFLMIKTYCV